MSKRPTALRLCALWVFGLALGLQPRPAAAEAGVLIPVSLGADPDPSKLSLRRVDIDVRIDHLHARVAMKQIFENHTDEPLEARYVLPLGERAGIEDFSVWDAEERLVGVVVEKQRGRRLFEQITAQKMDPGLAESEDDKDKGRQFALRVAPIPPHGTTRVEVVYAEELLVSSLGAVFTLPLSPRLYGEQRAGEAHITLQLSGEWPLERASIGKGSPLKLSAPVKAGDTALRAEFHGRDVNFTSDATVELRYAAAAQPRTTALAYRDPTPRKDLSPFGDGFVYKDTRGFFLLRALFNGVTGQAPAPATEARPRDVVVALDTSLSMQWEKLERSFAAVEHFLSRLGPRDRFGLVLFNDDARPFKPDLSPAGAGPVGEALRFVRESYLSGGSDIGKAVASASGLLGRDAKPDRERFLVLISDGRPTRGELQPRPLGKAVVQALQGQQRSGRPPVRLFILGVGDDAAVEVLRGLAEAGDGSFAWARAGAEADFKLRTFFDKLGQATWKDVALTVAGVAGIEQVLPAAPGVPAVYAGSDVLFAGRYKTAGAGTATVAGRVAGQPYAVTAKLTLPAEDLARPWIARTWARLRIDELLGRIAQDGERDEWVQEIIALAKEFHLATPYTSFLAAPRALLRPRAIQPGDPVLRVKAGPDIRAVSALFPFGLHKALRYLPDEDLWETRFLAPTWMSDGTYRCTLVLTDREGHKQREDKTFVIDSRAPRVTLRLPARTAAAGRALQVVADADPDTRRLLARLGDGPSVELRWDAGHKGSIGEVLVPPDLAPGVYPLTVTAEDFAHNVSARQVEIAVVAGAADPGPADKALDRRTR